MPKPKRKRCPWCHKLFTHLSRHKCRIHKIVLGITTLNYSGISSRIKYGSIKAIEVRKYVTKTKATTIGPVNKMINLTVFNAAHNGIDHISGLDNLVKLKKLWLQNNRIFSTAGLESLVNLCELNLSDNVISDLSGLEKSKKLSFFILRNNCIKDMQGLANLTGLKQLWLRGNQIENICGLDKLEQLFDLDLSKNRIANISSLENTHALGCLNLAKNKITKIEGLDCLTDLYDLNLSCNRLEKIEGLGNLTKLKNLDLSYNAYLCRMEGLANLRKLEKLKLDGCSFPTSLLTKLGGLDEKGFAKDIAKIVSWRCENPGKKPHRRIKVNPAAAKGRNTIDTASLHQYLLKILRGDGSTGGFEEDGPPSGITETIRRGRWLWVKSRLVYEGATWDQSTDRASGDPYEAQAGHDWIGPSATAPGKVSRPSQLERWALISTNYLREYTDKGCWGNHKGRWVEDLSPDGIATLYIADEQFHDVSPISTTAEQIIDLKRIEETISW